MNVIIKPGLKPISANLKRLHMGNILFDKEFKIILEEHNLDNIWHEAEKTHSKAKTVFLLEIIFEEQTEIFIIGLNILY